MASEATTPLSWSSIFLPKVEPDPEPDQLSNPLQDAGLYRPHAPTIFPDFKFLDEAMLLAPNEPAKMDQLMESEDNSEEIKAWLLRRSPDEQQKLKISLKNWFCAKAQKDLSILAHINGSDNVGTNQNNEWITVSSDPEDCHDQVADVDSVACTSNAGAGVDAMNSTIDPPLAMSNTDLKKMQSSSKATPDFYQPHLIDLDEIQTFAEAKEWADTQLKARMREALISSGNISCEQPSPHQKCVMAHIQPDEQLTLAEQKRRVTVITNWFSNTRRRAGFLGLETRVAATAAGGNTDVTRLACSRLFRYLIKIAVFLPLPQKAGQVRITDQCLTEFVPACLLAEFASFLDGMKRHGKQKKHVRPPVATRNANGSGSPSQTPSGARAVTAHTDAPPSAMNTNSSSAPMSFGFDLDSIGSSVDAEFVPCVAERMVQTLDSITNIISTGTVGTIGLTGPAHPATHHRSIVGSADTASTMKSLPQTPRRFFAGSDRGGIMRGAMGGASLGRTLVARGASRSLLEDRRDPWLSDPGLMSTVPSVVECVQKYVDAMRKTVWDRNWTMRRGIDEAYLVALTQGRARVSYSCPVMSLFLNQEGRLCTEFEEQNVMAKAFDGLMLSRAGEHHAPIPAASLF